MVSPALPLVIGAASTLAQKAIIPATVDFASTLAQATARLGAGIARHPGADPGATAGLASSSALAADRQAASASTLRQEARAALAHLHSAMGRLLSKNRIDASDLAIEANDDGRLSVLTPHSQAVEIEQLALGDREVSSAVARVVHALATLHAVPARTARLFLTADGLKPQGVAL
jgi:hypothetical protein